MSIVKSKELMNATPFIPERHQKQIRLYLLLHRGLMCFFLLGYIIVTGAIVFRSSLLSETFVSVIFFLGAVFVFIGIVVQSRLLAEIQQTLQGILPICAKCKKVRNADGNPLDQTEWHRIEAYISERVDVEFSHGYCPDCVEKEMKNVDKMGGIP